MVALYVCSESLDKDEVSALLDTQPVKAWNPHEPHFPGKSRTRQVTKPFGQMKLVTKS